MRFARKPNEFDQGSANIQCNVADDCTVVGKADIFIVLRSMIWLKVLAGSNFIGNEGSLDVNIDGGWREDGVIE